MNTAVRIPLTLELSEMNSQLTEMRKKLNAAVRPDTTAYKQLEKILKKAEKDLSTVSIASQKNFSNSSDIQRYQQQVEGLVSDLKSFWSILENLDGSQLKIVDTDEIIEAKKELFELAENLRFIQQKRIGTIKDGKRGTRFDDDVEVQKAAELVEIELTPEIKFSELETQIKHKLEEIAEGIRAENLSAGGLSDTKNALTSKKSSAEQALTDQITKIQNGRTPEKIKEAVTLALEDMASVPQEVLDDVMNKIGRGKGEPSSDLANKIYQEIMKSLDAHLTASSTRVDSLTSQQATLTSARESIKQSATDSQRSEIIEIQRQIDILRQKLADLYQAEKENNNILGDTAENYRRAERAGTSMLNKISSGLEDFLDKNKRAEKMANMRDAIKSWMGFNSVINMSRDALRGAYQHIVELDKVMTEIAVVTDMTQAQLWDQISTYSKIAQQYGATTEGVYQVSQLYYQQGLQTADVMKLTEETLKMAKIAGIEYKDATDYMTVAIRGFKMEMADAQRVVDVYSHIAAITASDTEELAVAMSKTASSAEAVGSSFENTTAMIALMVETTREAPENIGSALKSIISRYGEMTSDPTKLVDSEGEEMNLNKVDKALKSVGITLQDANGQFRNFDEVILELSSKWDTIDTNTQRYIATVMAGNRQQSRFLAMVGNYERLAELSEEAADSEDAALIQTLKTMDSIDTKLNQLKVTFQEFYTSSGVEDLIKGILDFVTRIINTMNSMPKLFGKIPIAAIGVVAQIISSLKNLSTKLLGVVDNLAETLAKKIREAIHDGVDSGLDAAEGEINKRKNEESSNNNKPKTEANKKREAWTNSKGAKALGIGGTIASAAGTVLTSSGIMTATGSNRKSGLMQTGGAILSIGGAVASGAATGGLPGAIIGGIIGLVGQIPTFISAINEFEQSGQEIVAELEETAEAAKQEELLAKNEYKNIETYKKKLNELNKVKGRSNEDYQEWLNLNNEIVEKYPELLSYIDMEGNKIAVLSEEWKILNEKKEEYYKANRESAIATLNYETNAAVRYYKGMEGTQPYETTAGRDIAANLFNEVVKAMQKGSNQKQKISEVMDEVITDYTDRWYVAKESTKVETYHKFFKNKGIGGVENIVDEYADTKSWANRNDPHSTQVLSAANGTVLNHDYFYQLMLDTIDYISGEEGKAPQNAEEVNKWLETRAADAIAFAKASGVDKYLPQIDEATFEAYSALGRLTSKEEQNRKIDQTKMAISQYVTSEDALRDSIELSSQMQIDSVTSDIYKSYADWVQDAMTNETTQKAIRGALGKADGATLGEGDYLQYFLENEKSMNRLIEDSLDGKNGKFASQIEQLTTEEQEELDSIYLSASNYSFEQWREKMSSIFHGEMLINEDELKAMYDKKVGNFYEEQVFLFATNLLSLFDNFNAAEKYARKFSSSSLNAFSSLLEKGLSVSSIKALGDSLNGEELVEFSKLTSQYDITSLSGLMAIKAELAPAEGSQLDSAISDIREELNINLETEWLNFSSSLVASLQSLEESLSKVSSGMNLEEAKKMAEKLGISITEFELVDGQFFFRDLNAIQEYYLKHHETLQSELKKETESQIGEATGVFGQIFESEAIDPSTLSGEMLTLYNRYAEEWTNSGSTLSLGAYIEEQLNLLLEENLTVSENYRDQQIQQITEEYTKQIFEIVSNAITGSMSNGELTTLTAYLENQGANLNLKYFETADGLQLTQDSVLQVYKELLKVDSLAAQVVLEELAESAMESNENLNNTYKVLKKIKDLNKAIAEAEDGSEREEALKRELELAEKIKDKLMEAGNAFDFMNTDISTNLTNPLSAWNSMGSAFKVLGGDDFKAGRMKIEDLNGMLTMLESAGVGLDHIATDFNGNAITASELITAAWGSLTTIDGETFVDFSELGKKFKINASGFGEGITEGIHEIARQQIKILDAQIMMFENIVAIEEAYAAFEGISGEDGEVSSTEILKNLFAGSDYNELSIIYQNLLKLESEVVSINGVDKTIRQHLADMRAAYATEGENSETAQTIALGLYNYIRNTYGNFNGIDWSTIGEGVYGNGVELPAPPVTFYTTEVKEGENHPFYDYLKSLVGGESIDAIFSDFNKWLERSGKQEYTIDDFINFIEQDGISSTEQTLYNALVEARNGAVSSFIASINEAKNTEAEGEVPTISLGLKYKIDSKGQILDENGEVIDDAKTAQVAVDEIAASILTTLGIDTSSSDIKFYFNQEDPTHPFGIDDGNGVKYYDYDGFVEALWENGKEEGGDKEKVRTLTVPASLLVKSNGTPEIDGDLAIAPTNLTVQVSESQIHIKDKDGKPLNFQELIFTSDALTAAFEDINVEGLDAKAGEALGVLLDQILTFMSDLTTGTNSVEISNLPSTLRPVNETLQAINTIFGSLSTSSEDLNSKLEKLSSTISSVFGNSKTLSVDIEVKTSESGAAVVKGINGSSGNKANVISLTTPSGSAKATGTLMGELGPELYVTGGRYYVAGQNGAEFVNLPSDAIVFNHLQTKKLLGNGSINGTGRPITSERNAVAMATGTTGPAMASAQETLDELRRIRAAWASLLEQSSSDFAKKAGSGSGSGSGEDNKAFMHDLERWYNLLRQIAKLEQQITYEQAKRENMRSGYNHVQSLEKELALLKKQQKAHQLLSNLQKDYYDKRRKELLSTDYSKIFTYDDEGLMQYVDGKNRGLDILATLNKTDEHGKALMTAKQQIQYLKDLGFDISKFQINADGSKVKSNDYQTMMQIFWDGVDGWMAELDELYDSYNDSMTSVEEAIQAQNEIMQEYIDNQLSVEERLMEAIVSREEAEIERLEKELDALEEATDKYLDGLKDSLDREKQMYERNKDSEETAKLQRQLAILKRTGGSASEIQSLQDEISSRLEDSYFQQQEDQIDALEQAANNQIEKLQNQIDIMNESLEYQKANGLLWEEVYEMMNNWSPEQMLQFIEEFLPSYRENSALQNDQDSQEALKEFEIWVAKRENAEALANAWQNYYDSVDQYSDEFKAEHAEGAKNAYNLAYATEGEDAAKKAADDYYAKQASLLNGSGGNGDEEKEEEQPETGTTPVEGGGESSKKASQTSGEIKRGAKGEDVKAIQKALSSLGYYKGSIDGIFGEATQSAVYAFQKAMGIQADGIVGNKTREKFKLKGYKTGGLVDFTGPAWVDGTKTKPEAFLSAEDTAMLKSKIFDNNKYSLRSIVELFEGIDNNGKNITTNNDQGVVFENIQITIESGTIANDYDARRAGEMALEEMLKISRKATNRIVSRR